MTHPIDFTHSAVLEPEELYTILQESTQSIRLLDASFYLPGSGDNAYRNYTTAHIPHSQFFDITDICDKSSPLPHMLPSIPDFEAYIRQRNIDNTTPVVIYGQSGIIMGPARAWWMFRIFGHDNVIILNGGLPAWKKAGYPLISAQEENTEAAAPKTQVPPFKADFRPHLLAKKEDIENFVETHDQDQGAVLLDARPANRFAGEIPEPRPGMRAGHIDGSSNIPASSLIDSVTQKLLPNDTLTDIFAPLSLDNTIKITTTCGSGVTACVIALALFQLGYKDVAVYDGSWSEWGQIEQ